MTPVYLFFIANNDAVGTSTRFNNDSKNTRIYPVLN